MTKGRVAPSRVLGGHDSSVLFVAFLFDDQIISVSNDKTIRRFCVSDGKNEVLGEGMVCAAATSPDGRWLGIGGRDGRVQLMDLRAPKKVSRSVEKHADMIKSLSFSPDSTQLASGSLDGTMLVWSSETLKPVARPFEGYNDTVWCVSYSPDGKKIASCDREVIQIWEIATRIGLTIAERAWSLAWSSEGNIVFAGCIDGSVKRYDSNTGMLYNSCQGHTDVVFSIVLSRNTKFIATASWDRTIRFFEAVTFREIGPALKHDSQVHSVSITPDDNHIVSGARDPKIRIWHLRDIAPALFMSLPLEPMRRPVTKGFHLPWPTSINNFDFDCDHNGSDVESLGSSDRKSIGSQGFKKPRLHILKNPFKSGPKQGGALDSPSTPGSSVQGSSCTDSPRTDNMSFGSTSSYLMDDPISVSPAVPNLHILSPLPITVGDSENWKFIREIRSDPTHDLSGKIIPEGTHPVTGGSHGDIYRGTLHVNGKAIRVAIKAIKRYLAHGDDRSKRRRLRREINLWLRLDHKNVLPFLGITTGYGDFPAMVCPWVENGHLTSYLKSHYVNLTAQQRWGIINDVALGLQYLHSKSIVHGDISGANILVHDSGRACISDFGLSFVAIDLQESSLALTYQIKGTLCWTAPELFETPELEDEDENENEGRGTSKSFPTVQSDIYSFGGIMFQVLTGKRPYHHLSRDQMVVLAISRGDHPKRPASTTVVSDDQWEFMMQCWSFVATDRPSGTEVVMFVHEQLRESTLEAHLLSVTGKEKL